MTESEIVDRGTRAEILMQDENFNYFYELMQGEIGQDILTTSRKQNEIREDLFLTFDGIRSFLSRLHQYVIEKDRIVNPEMFEDEASDDFDH